MKYEDDIIAYRCLYEECEDIPVRETNDFIDLPDDLIVEYGCYRVFERAYSLDKDGLYRFIQPSGECRQVIVYGGVNADNLISALSWVTVHGNMDDLLSFEEKCFKALHQKLILTCGYASLWASKILKKNGIENRIVTTLTLDKWNSYDNGHTMLEVYKESINKWCAYDIDNGITFSSGSGCLNLCELCNVIRDGVSYQINYLSSAASYMISSEYSLYWEKILSGEINVKKWYKRVLQVPMIKSENGKYFFYDEDNRKRVEAYSNEYLYVKREIFMENFYYGYENENKK